MSRYDHGGWRPYVSVGQRQANARLKMEKLRKSGMEIQPVERIKGRIIARSFWGKGWCDHLESFGDHANRLPRGKTYVRNGSVCHLKIDQGKVKAIVAGSELYHVNIGIDPLNLSDWSALKRRCTGKIGSLLELLQGHLSEEIMGVVTDRKKGLFPQPGQITYDCDCPDWASMCKHIAAVVYGIGARLDDRPELLFLLRGVDHEELIDTDAAVSIGGRAERSGRSRRRTLDSDSLKDVFGIELEEAETDGSPRPLKVPRKKATAKRKVAKKAKVKVSPGPKKKNTVKTKPAFRATGRAVAALRKKLGLSKAAFAREIGVSSQTVTNWESVKGAIRPHAASMEGLRRLHGKNL